MCFQQAGDGSRLGHGDEHRGLGIGQNARVAAHVLLDLGKACGRIDRYRYAAGTKNAEIGGKVVRAGWQHDRHGLTGIEAGALQSRRHGAYRLVEIAVTDIHVATLGEAHDLNPVRVRAEVPVEHIEEGGGSLGRGLCRLRPVRRKGRVDGVRQLLHRARQGIEHIAQRLHVCQRLLG